MKASTRGSMATVRIPTSRPTVAHQASVHEMGLPPAMDGDDVPKHGRAEHGDREAAAEQGGEAGPQRRQVEARPEGLACPEEHDGTSASAAIELHEVAVADQVQGDRAGEQEDRHEPCKRWPRLTPRARASRPTPAKATSAPAASLTPRGM